MQGWNVDSMKYVRLRILVFSLLAYGFGELCRQTQNVLRESP